MDWSFPAAGHPINCVATRACYKSFVISTRKTKLLARSAMAAGFRSQQASCEAVRQLARLASRTILQMLEASGSMNLHSVMATWFGEGLLGIFHLFVASR